MSKPEFQIYPIPETDADNKCKVSLFGKRICKNEVEPEKRVCKECYEFFDNLFGQSGKLGGIKFE